MIINFALKINHENKQSIINTGIKNDYTLEY